MEKNNVKDLQQDYLTEGEVLQQLEIQDFSQLTKDKVVLMGSMLNKMDPEVAKKALEQFPDFSNTMCQIFSEYKELLGEGIKQNAEGVKSCYATRDAIITSCQKELEKEELSFEDRKFILGQMMLIADKKDEKNTEDKKYNVKMVTLGLIGVSLAAVALLAFFGGNFKSEEKC